MEEKRLEELVVVAIRAALDAGKEILDVYNTKFDVEVKGDDSPLTLADKKGHNAIVRYLNKTGIPVLSEEGEAINYEERKFWKTLWIVDPLDGTKEFIKRNGEFTVNIALVAEGIPIAGVIYVPVKRELYFSICEKGAYKLRMEVDAQIKKFEELTKEATKLPVFSQGTRKFTVVASRSHGSEETDNFIEEMKIKYGEVELISIGSSLKLCLVAEGLADVYPRYAPTMEWDTAAGQAIAMGAGKNVIDCKTKETMRYNRENLLNNWFTVE